MIHNRRISGTFVQIVAMNIAVPARRSEKHNHPFRHLKRWFDWIPMILVDRVWTFFSKTVPPDHPGGCCFVELAQCFIGAMGLNSSAQDRLVMMQRMHDELVCGWDAHGHLRCLFERANLHHMCNKNSLWMWCWQQTKNKHLVGGQFQLGVKIDKDVSFQPDFLTTILFALWQNGKCVWCAQSFVLQQKKIKSHCCHCRKRHHHSDKFFPGFLVVWCHHAPSNPVNVPLQRHHIDISRPVSGAWSDPQTAFFVRNQRDSKFWLVHFKEASKSADRGRHTGPYASIALYTIAKNDFE